MFIPETVGRPIPVRHTPRLLPRALATLAVLDLVAVGGLLAVLLVNRLLNAQLEIYGQTYMAAASAILDLKDDLLPYLQTYIGAASVLTVTMFVVWAFSGSTSGALRIGIIALLVALGLYAGLWVSTGRDVGFEVVPPATPTLTVPPS